MILFIDLAALVIGIIAVAATVYYSSDNIVKLRKIADGLANALDHLTKMSDKQAEATVQSQVVLARVLDVSKDLREYAQRVSTRTVGAFPEHIVEIAKLVDSAADKVEVFADCADYGAFSPAKYQLLDGAIQRARSRPSPIDFHILIAGPRGISACNRWHDPELQRNTPAFNAAMNEFLDGLRDHYAEFCDDDSKHKALYEKVRNLAASEKTSWLNPEVFQIREQLQRLFHDFIRDRFEKYYNANLDFVGKEQAVATLKSLVPQYPLLYFWLADRMKAVILIPCPRHDAIAISTFDPEVVVQLGAIFDELKPKQNNAGIERR